MLALTVAVLLATCLAGGAYFASRAPAVTFALFGAVVWGSIGYVASVADGRRGVPADVALWATSALLLAGVVGLFAVPARAPGTRLRRAAAGVLIVGPFAVAALAVLLLEACPLYVTERAGFCDYGTVDVLGGWVTEIVVLFGLDVVAVVVLLLLSARRSERPKQPNVAVPGEPPHLVSSR